MRHLGFAVLLVSGVCLAQSPQAVQPPATPQEVQYFRYMLLNVASLDHDPAAVSAYENSLVKLHGLSAQESAVIHSAGQTLHATLTQNRQSASAIIAGRTALEASDVAALKELDRQREMTIVNLANQILNSVSAEVAARLRGAGHILAATLHQN